MNDSIEIFKSNNDIVDVISSVVALRKVGKNMVGLCPFHEEKSPSFSVSQEKQKYKCFGCGEYGDVIDFICKTENRTYEDVVGIDREKKEFIEEYIKNNAKYVNKNDQRYDYVEFYIYSTSIENVTSLKIKYRNLELKDKTFRQYVIDFRKEKPSIKYESQFKEEFEIGMYCNVKVSKSISSGKYIFIVEGEKDAINLNKMGYTATTFPRSEINELNLRQLKGAKIILLGDTGKAGEDKKSYCKNKLIISDVESLRVPILKGLKQMGNNKDVTDWLEVGNTKKDIESAINNSWDIKKNEKFKLMGTKEGKDGEVKEFPLKVWENLYSLLISKGIDIAYNDLSKEIDIEGQDLYSDDIDALITKIRTICTLNGFTLSKNDTWDYLKTIAKENRFNPVKNYLRACESKWDRKSRIQELCDTIEGHGNKKFNDTIITKWLLNAVHTIENTGKSNQEGILVIQGEQGIGKTRWIRSIVPSAEWVKTGAKVDPSDKDSIAKATKYWITELGEMDATLKKDQAELKQFFTEPVDEYREPYSVASKKFPRLTTFYATVNDEEFLRDTTGNRRYWVISAENLNVEHGIDLEQLWGEIYCLYKSGKMVHYLEAEELKEVNENNGTFEVKTAIEIKIMDLFRWDILDPFYWEKLSCTDICNLIGTMESVVSIGKTIKKMMLTNKNIKFDSHGRKYLFPPTVYNREKIKKWEDAEKNNRLRSIK